MRKVLFYLLIFSLAPVLASAGNDNPPAGARAVGLGNASVTNSDIWSLTNNVAGIGRLKNNEAGVYVENRFGLRALSSVGFQGVYAHEKYGSFGADLYRFGDNSYNEQKLGFGFGHMIGNVSLGVKADLIQVGVEEFGTRRAVALSFGGQSEVIPGLVFGANMYNINQAKLAEAEDERIPTILKAGLSYKPISRVMLNVETEKNIDFKADFKAGIEYQIIEKLSLRTGFSTLTDNASFGAGFKARAFNIDYAFSTQSMLGISNHLSISYKFE